MKVGGKAQLTCPPRIAYGERGAGGGAIPPNAGAALDVALLAINP
jgi:FKBP-type peptidyl-prolyl cis-trans isomerase FkpA